MLECEMYHSGVGVCKVALHSNVYRSEPRVFMIRSAKVCSSRPNCLCVKIGCVTKIRVIGILPLE